MASTVFLFPGQGAQFVGMGQALTERSRSAKELFDQARQILGFDLLELCVNGPADQLNRTEFCQPALFVHSYAALQDLLQQRPGLSESLMAVAGLSLGEYTAVAAAQGLSFEDALRLVHQRGMAMQAAADTVASGMSSILGLELSKIEAICDTHSTATEFVKVANLLCPGNIAISGHANRLDAVEQACLSAGAMKAVRLAVAGAFHTSIMQPAVEQLSRALAQVTITPCAVPVVSNVDAQPHSAPSEIIELLARQVVSPVLWEQTLRNLVDQGAQQFIEIGAGRVLAGTLKRIDRKISCESFGD